MSTGEMIMDGEHQKYMLENFHKKEISKEQFEKLSEIHAKMEEALAARRLWDEKNKYTPKQKPSVWTPKEGYISNPFRHASLRNLKCPCHSGRKIKKCCGETLAVSADWYKNYKPWVEAHKEK